MRRKMSNITQSNKHFYVTLLLLLLLPLSNAEHTLKREMFQSNNHFWNMLLENFTMKNADAGKCKKRKRIIRLEKEMLHCFSR